MDPVGGGCVVEETGGHVARGLDPAKGNFKFCVNVNRLDF